MDISMKIYTMIILYFMILKKIIYLEQKILIKIVSKTEKKGNLIKITDLIKVLKLIRIMD